MRYLKKSYISDRYTRVYVITFFSTDFAYATDLFKFKFGEIDWEMIRAEKLDAIREGSEEEEETEAEEVITVSTIEQVYLNEFNF